MKTEFKATAKNTTIIFAHHLLKVYSQLHPYTLPRLVMKLHASVSDRLLYIISYRVPLSVAGCLLSVLSFSQGTRLWATYYGGTGTEIAFNVATDGSGNVYITGRTNSAAGIASGGFQNTFGGSTDAYLVKFDAAGNRLWATYYGGVGNDRGLDIAIDASGNIYLTGSTSSTTTTNIAQGGFQNTYGGGGSDAFLAKFDASGTRLWATYYGGTANDVGSCVSIDASGNVYMGGYTASIASIASGGFDNTYGGAGFIGFGDAFLVKFDAAGNRLWATYYGGSGDELGNDIATDAGGNIYLTGQTGSSFGIASGGFQNTYGGALNYGDAFLVKFDGSGNRLWATYYGGTSDDSGNSVTIDVLGNVYIAGDTQSATGISSGGFQNIFAGGGTSSNDAFLVKFNAAGNRLWATYYGGADDDYALGVATDGLGNVYIGGDTYSPTGIASGGFQNNLQGTENEFVAKFDANGNRICATYYGLNHEERGKIAVDGSGNVYLLGDTPTSGLAFNGFDNAPSGNDTYLVKLGPCGGLFASVNSAALCSGGASCPTLTVTGISGTNPYSYSWSNGATTQTINPCPTSTSNYTATITDANGNTATAVAIVTISPSITVLTSVTNITCNGSANGSAIASPGGGTTPYSYNWSNGSSTASTSNLVTQTYTVTVTDAKGCSTTSTAVISSPPHLTVQFSKGTATCSGCGCKEWIMINATGGTSPYSYLWPDGYLNRYKNQLCPGAYAISIKDKNGCSVNVNLTAP